MAESEVDYARVSASSSRTSFKGRRHPKYSLKSGVLAYTVSLQLQCLLFIVGHVHEFSSTAIGLLPTSIRRKLLLHLPVADILKLECTPITANISMDDLWQALFNTRMPPVTELIDLEEADVLTPEKFEEKYKINFNWKDAYFQSLLELIIFDQSCVGHNLIPDLLYGVYDFHNTSFEACRCFDNDKIDNFHNLYRYTRQCPRFTTSCYRNKFTNSTTSYEVEISVSIYDLLELFSHSKSIPFKVFHFNDNILNNWISGYLTLPNIKWLFSSVEGICVYEDIDKLHHILDLIFVPDAKSTVKSMFIYGSFEVVSQYLWSSYSCLKTLHIQINNDIVGFEYEIAGQILDHQKELEEVEIDTSYMIDDKSKTIKAICDLLWRPCFKKLILSAYKYFSSGYRHCPSVLEHFFSSPYPVTLELYNISYSFAVPFQVNQGSSKSLTLSKCTYFSEDPSSSLASSKLFFKNLTLSQNQSSVHRSLAKMESIEVEETFTLNFYSSDISDICSLFSVVTAQQWDLEVIFLYDHNNIKIFTSALPNIKGTLHSLSTYNLSSKNMLSLLETVFSHLESTEAPYFELTITDSEIDDETLKAIYYTWEKCGSVKLKKVNMTGNEFTSNDICNSILSEMTIEYTL